MRIRFGDELLILNNWQLASLLGKEAGQIKTIAEHLPPWVLLVGIAGRDRLPEERVAYQEKDISEMAQKYGLQLTAGRTRSQRCEVLRAVLNPSTEPYWKLVYKGGCQDIFFLNTLEKSPEFVQSYVLGRRSSGLSHFRDRGLYPAGTSGSQLSYRV